jgi:membrane protein implicated in regulation of membrane protease activity
MKNYMEENMAKKIVLTAILAIALVWGMTVVGCGGGGDAVPIIPVPQMVSYQSTDTAGYTYILVITVNGYTAVAGDSYVLTITKSGQPDKKSAGTVSVVGAGGAFTLKPTNAPTSFTVNTSGTQITAFSGPITLDDGETLEAGEFTGGNNNNNGNNSDGGTFTLTGIPAQYNGKYALINAGGETVATNIMGFNTINMSTVTITLPVISNGSVSMPMWIPTNSGESFTRYSGNHTLWVDVVITNRQSFHDDSELNEFYVTEIRFDSVTFSNGSATRSWSQGNSNNGNNSGNTGGAPQWTSTYIPYYGTGNINAIAYGNGKFVATGATSTDGITWTAISNGGRSIAYGNGKFVAVSQNGSIRTSTDGTTWTAVSNSIFGSTDTFTVTAIAYGNGMFVAGGFNANGGRQIAASPDGTTWTVVSLVGSGSAYIAYGNNIFVSAGYDGSTQTSTNGTGWQNVVRSNISDLFNRSNQILAITYCNNKFFTVGQNGKMATSTDGETWTAVTQSVFGFGDDIRAIAYGGGKFVAGGKSGKMAISTDGETWTAVTYNTFGTSDIYAIAYGGGKFVAGGYMGSIAYLSDN